MEKNSVGPKNRATGKIFNTQTHPDMLIRLRRRGERKRDVSRKVVQIHAAVG